MNWIVLPDQAAYEYGIELEVFFIIKVISKWTYEVAVFHRATYLCPGVDNLVLCNNYSSVSYLFCWILDATCLTGQIVKQPQSITVPVTAVLVTHEPDRDRVPYAEDAQLRARLHWSTRLAAFIPENILVLVVLPAAQPEDPGQLPQAPHCWLGHI